MCAEWCSFSADSNTSTKRFMHLVNVRANHPVRLAVFAHDELLHSKQFFRNRLAQSDQLTLVHSGLSRGTLDSLDRGLCKLLGNLDSRRPLSWQAAFRFNCEAAGCYWFSRCHVFFYHNGCLLESRRTNSAWLTVVHECVMLSLSDLAN